MKNNTQETFPKIEWAISTEFSRRRELDAISKELRRISELLKGEPEETKKLIQRKKDILKELRSSLDSHGGFDPDIGAYERVAFVPLQDDRQRIADLIQHSTPSCPSLVGSVPKAHYREAAMLEVTGSDVYSCGVDFGLLHTRGLFLDGTQIILPDWGYIWCGHEVMWKFPPPPCHSTVEGQLCIRVHSDYTAAMEPPSVGFHSVAFAHCNPDGSSPGNVDIGSIHTIILTMYESGWHDSGTHTFEFSFEVDGNVTSWLTALFTTKLEGRDGYMHTYGRWSVNSEIQYSITPIQT